MNQGHVNTTRFQIKNKYFKEVFRQALKAYNIGEVPVGCVIVKNGIIISRGYNLKEKNNISTYHAEIVAINKACKKLKSWRLDDCEIYTNLEPCTMCMGAIINSRIKKIYYSTKDIKSGALGGIININSIGLNHIVEVDSGCYDNYSQELLKKFFKNLRLKK